MAKQLHFNKNMEALKKLQAGVDKLSSVVGVTLGPKVFPFIGPSNQQEAFQTLLWRMRVLLLSKHVPALSRDSSFAPSPSKPDTIS